MPCVTDGAALVQESIETRWSELMHRLYVSSVAYQVRNNQDPCVGVDDADPSTLIVDVGCSS